jgi:outer membrane immunogenic protein
LNKFAIAISLVALSSATAVAADLPARAYTKAPAFVEANDWSGIYIGGQVGYDWGVNKYTYNNGLGVIESFNQSQVNNPGSAAGGGKLGVQGQFGKWVLGLEGNYDWLSVKQNDVSANALIQGAPRSLKVDGIAAVVGKVGYSFDNWLIYAKGGWADGSVGTTATTGAASVAVKKWQSGYTFGTGLDYRISKSWVAGMDFNYYYFKFDRTALNTGGSTSNWTNASASVYSLMFSLSYLFNWNSPVVAKF